MDLIRQASLGASSGPPLQSNESTATGCFRTWAYIYVMPILLFFQLGRSAYDDAVRAQVHRRRRKICRRAETHDVAHRASKKPKATEENSKASFLSLPVELRLQIYEYLYSPPATIIIKTSDQQGHVHGVVRSSTYCPCVLPGCCYYSECAKPTSGALLALPLTCRQIYTEAMMHLYRYNTFHFNEYETMLCIPEIIPTKHLRSIASLSLIFATDPLIKSLRLIQALHVTQGPAYAFVPQPPTAAAGRRTTWIQFWAFITNNFVGLRHLDVTFNRKYPKRTPRLEEQVCEWLLEPLFIFNERENQHNRHALRFDVKLAWGWLVPTMEDLLAHQAESRTVPFVLKRSLGCMHDTYE